MSCDQELQVGVVGAVIEVELQENCVSAFPADTSTVKEITVKKPDGTTFTRAAAFTNDGTDGKVHILSEAGDLDISGTYHIQVNITIPGWAGPSEIGSFIVTDNLV
jgi:hypothetical protein